MAELVEVEVMDFEDEIRVGSGQEGIDMRHLIKTFIDKYESLPVLWNPRLAGYKNKLERNKALTELLVSYKLINPYGTVKDVTKKINSLRSNYRKELNKVNRARSLGEEYSPSSWVYYALHFLDDSEMPENLEMLQDHPGPLENLIGEEIPQQLSSVAPYTPSVSLELSRSKKPHWTPKAYKVKRKIDASPTVHKVQKNHMLPKACVYVKNSEEEDTYLNQAKVWVEKLKTLDTKQRLFAEKAINDVLFEAQLGTLTKESVKINHPSLTSFKVTSSSPNIS